MLVKQQERLSVLFAQRTQGQCDFFGQLSGGLHIGHCEPARARSAIEQAVFASDATTLYGSGFPQSPIATARNPVRNPSSAGFSAPAQTSLGPHLRRLPGVPASGSRVQTPVREIDRPDRSWPSGHRPDSGVSAGGGCRSTVHPRPERPVQWRILVSGPLSFNELVRMTIEGSSATRVIHLPGENLDFRSPPNDLAPAEPGRHRARPRKRSQEGRSPPRIFSCD